MSSNAVIERRNKQIQDAIDGQNLKQALQLCEKRLKKGEDSPLLRAWKANILFSHADETHRRRGIAETLELCRTTPPISDIEALEMLHSTLKKLDEHTETARSIWQNAAKAKPQDLDVQLRWFTISSETGDWKTAQKAAMSLQNNFPKTRKYYFWAIFMCYLIAADVASSDAERNLFGTLAYRMISKAATSVPSDPKELLSPPRAIQTAEELSLLIKIYEMQDRYDELITLLNSEHLGVKSRIAQSDWSFVTYKLSILEKAGQWNEALAFTRELLALPENLTAATKSTESFEEKDDWKVWRLLLLATEKLEKKEYLETGKFITAYIQKRPGSRNAQLANLDLNLQGVKAGFGTPSDVLSGCINYFDRNHSKLYCFDDLQKYLVTLDSTLYQTFHTGMLQRIGSDVTESDKSKPSSSRQITVISALKFEYSFQLQFKNSKESRSQVEDFVCRCLRQFRDTERANAGETPSTIEAEPTDDLCLLAAMSLVRLYEACGESTPSSVPGIDLVQAAGILDHLLLKSPHNYEALLLLVRIYLLLGAGSLALKTFSQLSVKQIQYETVAHNLFTRISTIHPHSAPPLDGLDKKDYDPQTALRQALLFYRNSETATKHSLSAGLEHGSYINVEGSIDLQHSLKHSVCRKMWALEVRRTERLVGGLSTSNYDDLVSDETSLVDKRSFDGFMNCEIPGDTTFEERIRLGPLPKDRGVKAMIVTDSLFTFLTRISSQKASSKPLFPSHYSDSSTIDSLADELTPAEFENFKIHLLLLRLISISRGEQSPPPSIEDVVSQIETWLTEKSDALESDSCPVGTIDLTPSSSSSPAPSWIYLHNNILLLETLKAITLFVSFASKNKSSKTNISKEKIAALKTNVSKVSGAVKVKTQMLKMRISSSGMLGQLESIIKMGPINSGQAETTADGDNGDNSICKEIEEMMDDSSLELFCGSLMDSWDEALGGVISLCSSLK